MVFEWFSSNTSELLIKTFITLLVIRHRHHSVWRWRHRKIRDVTQSHRVQASKGIYGRKTPRVDRKVIYYNMGLYREGKCRQGHCPWNQGRYKTGHITGRTGMDGTLTLSFNETLVTNTITRNWQFNEMRGWNVMRWITKGFSLATYNCSWPCMLLVDEASDRALPP